MNMYTPRQLYKNKDLIELERSIEKSLTLMAEEAEAKAERRKNAIRKNDRYCLLRRSVLKKAQSCGKKHILQNGSRKAYKEPSSDFHFPWDDR